MSDLARKPSQARTDALQGASCVQVKPSNLSTVPLRAPIKGSAAYAEMREQQSLARPSIIASAAHQNASTDSRASRLSSFFGLFKRNSSSTALETPPPAFTPTRPRSSLWGLASRNSSTSHLRPVSMYSPAMSPPPNYVHKSSPLAHPAKSDETQPQHQEQPDKLFYGCC